MRRDGLSEYISGLGFHRVPVLRGDYANLSFSGIV
jgi:hypothetical protein